MKDLTTDHDVPNQNEKESKPKVLYIDCISKNYDYLSTVK